MTLPADWNSGGSALVDGAGRPSLRSLISPAITDATLAEIKAQLDRIGGQVARVGNNPFIFRAGSALAGDDVLVITPDAAGDVPGRWVRAPGQALLRLPFTFATANNAALLVVPAGCRFLLREIWWEVTVGFTGGASSAIGIHSTKTGYTVPGDLLGGAAGDVAATLVASANPIFGTVGVAFDTIAERRAAMFNPGEEIRFGRITSAFTAGSGAVNMLVDIVANAGA